jgi:hypothetical protein
LDKNRAYQFLQAHLQPGERLVWYDVPSPWRAAAGPLFKLAFMTLWAGFAYVWTAIAVSFAFINKPPSWVLAPFWLVGGAFCFIGTLGWLSSLKNVLNCWHIAYALTDRRVVISVGETGEMKSFTGSALTSLSRTGSSATGTIKFDYGPVGRGSGFRAGFYGIEQPARVEALIYENLIIPQKEGAPL